MATLERLADSHADLSATARFAGSIESYWLSYAALLVAAVGAYFAWRQLRAIRRQVEGDSRRHMREQALIVLGKFKSGMAATEYEDLAHVAAAFEGDALQALMKDEDVRVPDEVREKILATLATRLADNENALDGDKLNAHQRRALRSIFGDYANLLEEALFPVYAKVADREIVMQQIRPYLSGEILKDFEPLLRIYGRKYLPCTIAYIDEHQMTFFDWKERRRQSLQLLENQRHRGA